MGMRSHVAASALPTVLHSLRRRDGPALRTSVERVWKAVVPPAKLRAPRRGVALSDRESAQAQTIMETGPDAILDMAGLAMEIGVSLDGLNRSFRERTGRSAAWHMADVRLRHATRLMLTEPIVEAACAAGYASQSHLNGVLKECLGLTPGQFQREARARWKTVTDMLTIGWGIDASDLYKVPVATSRTGKHL